MTIVGGKTEGVRTNHTSRVDFYILPQHDVATCYTLACRLTEKAYRQKHRIYIHAPDQAIAHHIDDLLWTFRDESFIPHNLYGEGPTPPPPIQIGFQVTPEQHRDILINLSAEIPPFYPQFRRVIEIVCQDATWREQARQHFKLYREQGCELQSHKL